MNLYNMERPRKFSEIVGQEKTVRVLSKELSEAKYKNAYLFCGVRGTGKTSIARILAEAMNCEHPLSDGSPCGECDCCKEIRSGASLDVVELDAASNNSVEDVRSILQKVAYKPVHKRKVFILDEVHMLSNAASNALLKVLEEPPADVSFILCTTESNKVLPTIRSRCSVFTFEKIGRADISSHLAAICNKYGVQYEKDALDLIAKAADGGMRDALSILDQFMQEEITAEKVSDGLGLTTEKGVFEILSSLIREDAGEAVRLVKEIASSGGSLPALVESMFSTLLDITDVEVLGTGDLIAGTEEYRNAVVDLAFQMDTDRAFRYMTALREVYQKKNENIEFLFISSLISMIHEESEIERLKKRVLALEEAISNGEFVSKSGSDVPSCSMAESDANNGDIVQISQAHSNVEKEEDDFESGSISIKVDVEKGQAAQSTVKTEAESFEALGSDDTCPFSEELPSFDDVLNSLDEGPKEDTVSLKEEKMPEMPAQSEEESFDDFARQFWDL